MDRSDRLGLRKEECILLKAIIVSNCDVHVDEVVALRKLRDDLLASLHDCVAVIRYPKITKFIKYPLIAFFVPQLQQNLAVIVADLLAGNSKFVSHPQRTLQAERSYLA